jgi:hypothetical protein
MRLGYRTAMCKYYSTLRPLDTFVPMGYCVLTSLVSSSIRYFFFFFFCLSPQADGNSIDPGHRVNDTEWSI